MSYSSYWRRAGILILLSIFSYGCPRAYRSETVWYADGSVDRAIYQDRETTPESVRRSRVWLQTTSAPEPQKLERQGWSGPISKFPVKQPGEAGPYFAAWGHFQSPQDLPAHFIRKAPRRAGVPDGELVRQCSRTDYVLVREYRWRETLSEVVNFEEMRKARGQLVDLLIDFAQDALGEAFGQEYDTASLINWLRTDGKTWLAEITDYAYVKSATQKGPHGQRAIADGIADICARHGLALKVEGKLLEGEALEKALRDFVIQELSHHVRRKSDGRPVDKKTIATFLEDWNSSSSDTRKRLERAMDRVMVRKFGGKEKFEEQVEALLVRIVGLHGTPLLQGWNEFDYVLMVPGDMVETNGQILSRNKVRWQFDETEAYPLGYVMECRSLLPELSTQQELLQNQPLSNREAMLHFVALVADHEPLRDALRQCRKRKSMLPLYEYAESAATKSDKETQAVNNLLKLLNLPSHPETRREKSKGSAASDSFGRPDVLSRSFGEKLYADKRDDRNHHNV
jgi:hypothetical protein